MAKLKSNLAELEAQAAKEGVLDDTLKSILKRHKTNRMREAAFWIYLAHKKGYKLDI